MTARSKKEQDLLLREFIRTERKEKKFFETAGVPKKSPLDGLRRKIPQKAIQALEGAFKKGFFYLFDKGTPLLEKISAVDKAMEESAAYRRSLQLMIHPQTLKAIDKRAGSRISLSKNISAIEGAGLGVIGVGLPDIPVLLAMLLKTAYEIAAVYGIDFRDDDERPYTLAPLKTAFSTGETQQAYSLACDELGKTIDDEELLDPHVSENDLEEVSQVLAGDMLVAKFVQGQAVVGAIGGIVNYRLINKIARVARFKYKKRFLYRLLQNEEHPSE